jgi:predicted nuclease of predicted toxin-antitoxin system
MKILIDMNLSPKWVDVFSSHGIEAVHWSGVGAVNAADSEIMEYAHIHGFTILTHDLDFSAMLAVNRLKRPSLIQLRTGDISPDSAASLVINAIRQTASEIEDGAILSIELNKARLRILPLH